MDACIPKEERSDVVHDLLAFLAERMLEMNKQKLARRSGFPGLEGYVVAKVEDLTPKTKLQSYYEHDYDGFLAVKKKNRKKLAVDPARREPAETLKAEFEGSLGKLTLLRERIEGTDGLIDGCAASTGSRTMRSGWWRKRQMITNTLNFLIFIGSWRILANSRASAVTITINPLK